MSPSVKQSCVQSYHAQLVTGREETHSGKGIPSNARSHSLIPLLSSSLEVLGATLAYLSPSPIQIVCPRPTAAERVRAHKEEIENGVPSSARIVATVPGLDRGDDPTRPLRSLWILALRATTHRKDRPEQHQ